MHTTKTWGLGKTQNLVKTGGVGEGRPGLTKARFLNNLAGLGLTGKITLIYEK